MRRAPLVPLFLLAGALALAAPASVRAQTSPPKQPVVTAPIVTSNEGAAYPQQALTEGIHDEVEVPLVLTIDPTGAVSRVELEKPVGHGFDEAAIAAAQKLQFRPATRDGTPVAARQRFVYHFSPPPGVLSGRVLSQANERPIAGATVIVR